MIAAGLQIQVCDDELEAHQRGLGLHRLLETRHGQVVPRAGTVVRGEVDVGAHVIGLRFEHRTPLVGRRLVAPARGVDAREIHAIRNARRDRDGLAKRGLRLLPSLRREICVAEDVVNLGRVGMRCHERPRLGNHPLGLAVAQELHVQGGACALIVGGDPHRLL